jgi:hypothetical protein
MRIDGQQPERTEYDFAAESLRSMLFFDEGPGPFCSFALEWHGRETRGCRAGSAAELPRDAPRRARQ